MGTVSSMIWGESQTNSITPNSMSPIPRIKFINYARVLRRHDGEKKKPPLSSERKQEMLSQKFDEYFDKYNY